MNLRETICKLFNCSETKLLNDCYKKKELTQQGLNNCLKEKKHLLKKLEVEKDYSELLKFNLNQKQNEINELKQDVQVLSKSFSFPFKHITYARAYVGKNKQIKFTNIDVRTFVKAWDYEIYEDIKKHNLFYTGKENLDELIVKLYFLAKKKYKYAYDEQTTGFSEYWEFPFEVRTRFKKGIGSDCDSWAIFIGSYWACAGIPRTHWLLTAGVTRSGYGHATCYAKSSLGTWHHLNSTSLSYKYRKAKKVQEFPLNSHEGDSIGLKEFWFSWNDLFSGNKWETPQAEESFLKEKEMQKIVIEPKEGKRFVGVVKWKPTPANPSTYPVKNAIVNVGLKNFKVNNKGQFNIEITNELMSVKKIIVMADGFKDRELRIDFEKEFKTKNQVSRLVMMFKGGN